MRARRTPRCAPRRLRSRSSMSRTAWPEPSNPNVIASENGARSRAPGGEDQRVEAELCAVGAGDSMRVGVHRRDGRADEVVAPRSATISATEWRAADAKPNGSATVTGRSTNQSCCETSVRATRSPARARSASNASESGDATADDDDIVGSRAVRTLSWSFTRGCRYLHWRLASFAATAELRLRPGRLPPARSAGGTVSS